MAKYITINRLKNLAESINFLDTITDLNTLVGESLENVDKEKTEMLQELAAINARRFELMHKLTNE